jgi:hypothetical protein
VSELSAAAERTYRDAVADTQRAIVAGDLQLAEIDARNGLKEFPSNPELHLALSRG